jgi:hypothetical protein
LLKMEVTRTIDGLLVVCGDEGRAKVVEALTLIRDFDPIRYRRLCRDVERIWVRTLPGCDAQFDRATWTCDLEERFVLDEGTTAEMVASAIVHEATHARLDRRGFGYEEEVRARVEEICLRREVAFAAKLPSGTRAHERAEATLNALPDFSDEAMAILKFDGVREGLLRLSVPPWIADRVAEFARWSEKRRKRKQKASV